MFLVQFAALFATVLVGLSSGQITSSPNGPFIHSDEPTKAWLRTLVDVEKIDSNAKGSSFATISAEDKARTIRTQIALNFVGEEPLSTSQKQLLREALKLVDSACYVTPRTPSCSKSLEQIPNFEKRAKALFGKARGSMIFTTSQISRESLDRLRTYSEMLDLPSMEQRRDFFRNMSPSDKSSLWRMQLVLGLTKVNNLSEEQSEFLVKAIEFVTPSIFEVKESNNVASFEETDKSLRSFSSEAIRIFGKETAARIFAYLGGGEEQSSSLLRPGCECSHVSDWCLTECFGNVCTKKSGCGTFGWYECTGLCMVY